jgi:DNA polymerase-3 subunit gamma/tau
LKGESTEQRLQKAVAQFLNTEVQLQITIAKSDDTTPAQLQAKAQAQRQLQAEIELAEDPVVQAMEEQLGARLIPESIRAIDS